MLDKLGKTVSATATMYGTYNVGAYIYLDNYTQQLALYFILSGLIFSIVWTFYIMGSFVENLNRGALLRYGLVPALMWVLNAPAVKDLYINTVIDRQYIAKKQAYNKRVEPLEEKLTIYRAKSEAYENDKITSVEEKRERLDNWVNDKARFLKEKEGLYIYERNDYLKSSWAKQQKHDYKKEFTKCKDMGYKIPNNNTAPFHIAQCLYSEGLKDLQFDQKATGNNPYLALIKNIEQQIKELKFDYERIENSSVLKIYHFYIIMFLFGYFMEIKFANALFWIAWESSKGLKKELKKQEESATIAKNEHLYSTATAVKNTKKLSLIEATFNAVIRTAYKENITLDNMNYDIVQRNMVDISPRTGRPFLAKKYQKKIRDLLNNANFEQNKNKHGWLESVKNDIINSNTLR